MKIERGEQSIIAIAMIVLFVFSFVLGGASRQHELRLALVELSALPLLAVAGMALLRRHADLALHRSALLLAGALAALPLLQLIPLPPPLWTALPGRDAPAQALGIAGVAPGWAGISLTPDKTWRSFLALLPPLAMFAGVLACHGETRSRLPLLLLAGTGAGIVLGAAQVGSGTQQLYPWRTTEAGILAGFFANRNHMATLCLVCLPFAVTLGARLMRRHDNQGRTLFWLSILMVGLLIVTLGIIRSRAGVILVWPVLGASLVAAWAAQGRGRPSLALLAMVGAATVAMVIVALFALAPILARFDTGGLSEGRSDNWGVIWQAASTYLPIGSGLGSFDAVYRSVEPISRLDSTYFNQAHNEYLETWLEAGWLGVALVIAFGVWFLKRSTQAWRSRSQGDRDLQRAASIAIGAVLLHSAVDYPLRTETLAVLFAMACGLLEFAGRPPRPVATTRD